MPPHMCIQKWVESSQREGREANHRLDVVFGEDENLGFMHPAVDSIKNRPVSEVIVTLRNILLALTTWSLNDDGRHDQD